MPQRVRPYPHRTDWTSPFCKELLAVCPGRHTLAALLIGAVAFWLRFSAPIGPEWRDRSGGVAYVVFWIFVVACLAPPMKPWRATIIVVLITCGLEFAQLWHPAWLESIRGTFLGRSILGTTFGWSDFPPYFAGGVLGWMLLSGLEFVLGTKQNAAGV